MQKSPLFTILTAAFNAGATMRETLESIKNQNFQDFEHIVVDKETIRTVKAVVRLG